MATDVVIRMTRPYVFHRISDQTFDGKPKEKRGSAGNDPDEWRGTFYAEDDKLFIPRKQIFSTIRAGARHVKAGRGSIMYAVASTLQVAPAKLFIGPKLPPWALNGDKPIRVNDPDDTEADVFVWQDTVKNPATKGTNMRHRLTIAPGFTLSFELIYDPTIVGHTQMESALMRAGQLEGIGDGRRIGMGRFEVVSFETH